MHEEYPPSEFRGLLHDLTHELATLSCLAQVVRGEPLPATARRRADLLAEHLERVLCMVTEEVARRGDRVDVRRIAGQVAELAALRHHSTVTVTPGEPVIAPVDPNLVWRVLTNLAGNAARVADTVQITVTPADSGVLIEVQDDGPGVGDAPPGIGLAVAHSLVAHGGGTLRMSRGRTGGTTARVTLAAAEVSDARRRAC